MFCRDPMRLHNLFGFASGYRPAAPLSWPCWLCWLCRVECSSTSRSAAEREELAAERSVSLHLQSQHFRPRDCRGGEQLPAATDSLVHRGQHLFFGPCGTRLDHFHRRPSRYSNSFILSIGSFGEPLWASHLPLQIEYTWFTWKMIC